MTDKGDSTTNGKKIVVLSGINLHAGGPLSVYYDILNCLVSEFSLEENYEFIAFVSNKNLFKKYLEFVTLIELPKSRRSYLYRLWYEYFFFRKFSHKKNIYCWFSLHDISPRVRASKKYVYCHNPSPFYNSNIRDFFVEPIFWLFSKFYMILYKINIRSNTAVIVQQEWIKHEFLRKTKAKRVIVAHPNISKAHIVGFQKDEEETKTPCYTFFFPSFPRSFKNFELICEACALLAKEFSFRVALTISGNENRYSKLIYKKYHKDSRIRFVGLLSREEVFDYYRKCDCLLFPSKIETWGLPITEFKAFNKPIILADLPYAHETLGHYSKAIFVNPQLPLEMSKAMLDVMGSKKDIFVENQELPHGEDFFPNWVSLLKNEILK